MCEVPNSMNRVEDPEPQRGNGSELMRLLSCKGCGEQPKLEQVFCTGVYYKCQCGASANGFPVAQTEGLAKQRWQAANAR